MATFEENPAFDRVLPLLRRRRLVLTIIAAATLGTYGWFALAEKDYRASTRVLLGVGSSPVSTFEETLTDRAISDLAILLTSRDVAIRAAQDLGRRGEERALAGRVDVSSRPGSDFLLVEASSGDAQEAADIANAFAKAFIALRSDTEREQIDAALQAARETLRRLGDGSERAAERRELQRAIQGAEVSKLLSTGSAAQVDPALAPTEPAGPQTLRNAILALVLSAVAGTGLAYLLDLFDRRPRALLELPELYEAPLLASIPRLDKPGWAPGPGPGVEPQLKEPLRQLRTNLQLAALDRPIRRLLVTSALAGEGKSTLVRNLALVLSEGGSRVGVVDADLRRPTLARAFGRPTTPGLTDVLAGASTLREAVVNVEVEADGLELLERMGAISAPASPAAGDRRGIDLLPPGREPADPQAVLAAARTGVVLDELSQQFDLLIVDSPPLLHVTDAMALAAWTDAVVVVARLGAVTRAQARRVPEMLEPTGAAFLGIVATGVDGAENEEYSYAYGYGAGGLQERRRRPMSVLEAVRRRTLR